jgi:hypothetical protein
VTVGPDATEHRRRRRQAFLLLAVTISGLAVLGIVARAILTKSVGTLGDLDWPWLLLALFAESGSMAAFARAQRRLIRAGGTDVHLGSVMAVTYAGNAISVSLPLAGSEVATTFSFREFGRRGIDPAVVAWALAVSGIISSFAFAFVLAAGGILSGSTLAAAAGLGAAAVSLVPAVAVLAALRYEGVRGALNRLLDRLVRTSRRLVNRPGPGAEDSLERFLDRMAAIRVPRLQYAEVFALAVWNWVADCLCLACAIRATGTPIPWQGLFLAYGAGMTAGSLGLTPGGLGIIEAALSAALVAAGLKSQRALAAVLVYRLVSFWLIMAAGWAVMLVLARSAAHQPQPAVQPSSGELPS